jgi:hypothetical protein
VNGLISAFLIYLAIIIPLQKAGISWGVGEYVEREVRLLLEGRSPELGSLVWGIQLALSILLYPFLLTLTSLYQRASKSLGLPSKLYYLFLIALYAVSLAVSRYLARALVRPASAIEEVKPEPRGFSPRGLVLKLLAVLVAFSIISMLEGVSPLSLIESLAGAPRYTDPLSVYVQRYVETIPYVVGGYMRRLEELLRVLMRLLWG